MKFPGSAGLSPNELTAIDAYFRAANYLTVGQIYLQANPLLREPLRVEHIKPRLLGHWGTSPGLNLIYVHLNRLIRRTDANAIFLAGPGHGGPALLANVYLEGTYSEVYPEIARDLGGMRDLFRRFSTPGGVPSHVGAHTPGSIHEGGELGYVLVHAFGAVFDNPDLLAVAVVGDGEAETGPLACSWDSLRFLNPARDGAVLPILHLNGAKISGPSVLGREPIAQVQAQLAAHGYSPKLVSGEDPLAVHQDFALTLEHCFEEIRRLQRAAREDVALQHRGWPAIILRTPKGWTGPKYLDGERIEGTFRAHQVPLPHVRENAMQLAMLERWLRSYRAEELFDADGRLSPELAALAPEGARRMGANPHANGGRLRSELVIPELAPHALAVPRPAQERHESTRQLGKLLRDMFVANAAQRNFRLFCPDETHSNRLQDVFAVENRCFMGPIVASDDHLSPTGRVMEVLSEHCCQGWLEGYLLTGRHGLFATYEAFAMVSGSMTVQFAKWLEEACELEWRQPIASLNVLLTSTCWRNDHNGFSHQGPGLIDVVLTKRGSVARIYLPPDANCLLVIAEHCLKSRDRVNLIVIDKQPQLQWMSLETAREHCARGAGIFTWAGTPGHAEPDLVLGCAGDVPTLEVVGAAWLMRKYAPEIRVRVVNVVDLMALFVPDAHPHGISEAAFASLFTRDKPVVFAFHGHQRAIHQIVHGRPHAERFHVRGFSEYGTTTTPFDMVVLNGMSRYQLCLLALERLGGGSGAALAEHCRQMLTRHGPYIREHLEDMPEVREFVWTEV